MLLPTLLLLLPLAAAALLDAASRSPPFHLTLRSQNATFNNKAVSACHQGAQLTSLCATDAPVNLTQPGAFAVNTASSNAGILEFNALTPLTTDQPNATSTWFPMTFWWDVYTNTVMSFFQPLDVDEKIVPDRLTFVAGADGELLVMKAPVLDDRLAPDWTTPSVNETVNRWFVCETFFPGSYPRTSVVWGLGEGQPQNPTCVKVDVVKVVA